MSGQLTAKDVEVLIGAALVIVSAGLAIPGWLTNRQDSSTRFRLRFLSLLFLTAGWFLINSHPHGVWQWVILLAFGSWLFGRIQHWWRATEKARKAEAVAQRQAELFARAVRMSKDPRRSGGFG